MLFVNFVKGVYVVFVDRLIRLIRGVYVGKIFRCCLVSGIVEVYVLGRKVSFGI